MDRRKFIAATGGLLTAGGASARALAAMGEKEALLMPSNACRATIRMTQGPFLTPDSPLRSDIREDLPGAPIRMTLKIVNDFWCTPVEGAVVDIWQADARGLYSGVENLAIDHRTLRLSDTAPVDMRGESFLRGHQISDANGEVEFTTIFPGWYTGRLPHIHVRTVLAVGDWTAHDTQLFLPEDVERAVYATAPYTDRGAIPPRSVARDLAVKGDQQTVDKLTLQLDRDGDGFKGVYPIAISAL